MAAPGKQRGATAGRPLVGQSLLQLLCVAEPEEDYGASRRY